MKGIIYGVGVGPGDPENMTLKAVRTIRECPVIAVPGEKPEESVAWRIAAAAVPELPDKETVAVPAPMVRSRAEMERQHRLGADRLEAVLDTGRDVAYLTLGDPTVYCTFSYIQRLLEADGYAVRLISGVTSFCAAAARMNVPLAEWDEPLRILPAAHIAEETLTGSGTWVLMKSASRMAQVKEMLRRSGRSVWCVENAGMENEHIYRGVEAIPDDAGYFSLVVAREPNE